MRKFTPPRAVVIGSGMIGAIHRRAILAAGGVLIGTMASTPERSKAAAEEWGADAITSLSELAAYRPDVVHVCSPNGLHAAHVEAALECGAHVICEKPLSTDSGTARRLSRHAEKLGRVATVPFVYRFHPLVREARARVEAGDLGRWQLLHGSYLQDWLLDPGATSWRVDSRVGGASRAFADIGSHWCDLMEFVTGERIASLSAAMTITNPMRPANAQATFAAAERTGPLVTVDTEDAATIMFRTASGVLGSVVVSQVSAGRKNRLWFEFDGARSSVVFDQEQPETLWLGAEDQAVVVQRDPSRGAADQRRLSSLPPGHAQGYAQCFENFVADTYDEIRGQHRDGLPTFSDGLRSAVIVDAVVRSARSGRWIDVTAE